MTVRSIADELYVSATCEVDIASGLPEYPIHGHLEFTQAVTLSSSSLTRPIMNIAREEMTSYGITLTRTASISAVVD